MTKKVKRTVSLLIAVLMLLGTMSVLAFADNCPRTYAEATDKRVGPHDHVAAIDANGAVVKTEDKAAYAQPTCTKPGCKEFTINCSVCGAELSREKVYLPKLTSHITGATTIEDVVEPTCAKKGSFNKVVRCKICNEIISSTPFEVAKTTAHVAGAPRKENIVNATCAKVGSYDSVIYCKVCGKELQRTFKEIPKLNYHISNYSVVGFKNGTTRTCADGEERCIVCKTLINPAIPHVWDKGVTTVPATLTTQGKVVYTCLIKGCGATKSEYTPVLSTDRGDVDGDGKVTTADARFVLRFAVGLGNFDKVISSCTSDDSFKSADYDENGKIESADARLVLRSAVGLRN